MVDRFFKFCYTALMLNTTVRFTAINRKTGETKPCWIAGARFADGPGMKVSSIRTTFSRDEAATFSVESATAIAVQFCNSPAALETRSGKLLAEETAKLLCEQLTRYEAACEVRRQFNADLMEMLNEMPASVRTMLGIR